MTPITFIQQDGSPRTVQAATGATVMKAAIQNDVRGIVAECGGSLMCATCHVYVEPADADRVPPLGDDEDEMLDVAEAERLPTSRLSCQLVVTDDLHGFTVRVPDAQA